MNALENEQDASGLSVKARRAKRIILWVMAALIVLPFVMVWITGAVRF